MKTDEEIKDLEAICADLRERLEKIHFETRFVSPRIDEIRRLADIDSAESGRDFDEERQE